MTVLWLSRALLVLNHHAGVAGLHLLRRTVDDDHSAASERIEKRSVLLVNLHLKPLPGRGSIGQNRL